MSSSTISRSLGALIPKTHRFLRRLSYATAARFNNYYSDETTTTTTTATSPVYHHVLKFQRPATIRWDSDLHNTVNLIGTVEFPLKRANTSDGRLGVHTLLRVNQDRSLRVMLMLWDDIAEVAREHVKPDDFVYVSGRLEAYSKANRNGDLCTWYRVNVKELNYVAHGPGRSKKVEHSASEGSQESTLSTLEKRRERLHLWQVFFASPHEWWDNRKDKSNNRQPDFKHKSTGEALWLSSNDPPWVLKQLQMYDSSHGHQRLEHQSHHSTVSQLVYDDLEEFEGPSRRP